MEYGPPAAPVAAAAPATAPGAEGEIVPMGSFDQRYDMFMPRILAAVKNQLQAKRLMARVHTDLQNLALTTKATMGLLGRTRGMELGKRAGIR